MSNETVGVGEGFDGEKRRKKVIVQPSGTKEST